jgi:hypothetical protein
MKFLRADERMDVQKYMSVTDNLYGFLLPTHKKLGIRDSVIGRRNRVRFG